MSRRALGDGALEDLLPPRRPRRQRQDAGDGDETPATGEAGAEGAPAEPPVPSDLPATEAELPREPAAPAESRAPAESPAAAAAAARPRKPARPKARRGGKGSAPGEPPARKRLSFDLATPVAEAARDVVFWTPGLTLTGLVEEALEAEIRRRERQRGKAFPPRTGDLSPGPPMR